MDKTELEQRENVDKAMKAFNDLLDCMIKASPEHRRDISQQAETIFLLKCQDNPWLDELLKMALDFNKLGWS